jgi:hypothetical protein
VDWLQEVIEATAEKIRLEEQRDEQLHRRATAWRYAHTVEGLTPAEIVRVQESRLQTLGQLHHRNLGIKKDTVRRALESLAQS